MATLIKRENITISIGTYVGQSGETKNKYRTIGELVTMRGDDGSVYQFGEMWGATGSTKFKVYPQEDKNQQPAAQPASQQAPAYQQPAPPPAQRGGVIDYSQMQPQARPSPHASVPHSASYGQPAPGGFDDDLDIPF